MLSVGELLKTTRQDKGLKISEVSAHTKIRESMIQDLEDVNIDKFTSEMHFKSFLRAYSEFLGIDTERIMALYRRERNIQESKEAATKGMQNLGGKQAFIISSIFSIKTILSLVGIVGIGVVIWFFSQFWISLNTNPNLEIISPANNSVIQTPIFTIEGRTDGNDVRVVLDGKTAQYYDSENTDLFRINAEFENPGFRSFLLTAENSVGKTTSVTLDLTYEPTGTDESDQNNNDEENLTDTNGSTTTPSNTNNANEENKETPTFIDKDSLTINISNPTTILQEIEIIKDNEDTPETLQIEPEKNIKVEFQETLEVTNFKNDNLDIFIGDRENPISSITGTRFSISFDGNIPVITNLAEIEEENDLEI